MIPILQNLSSITLSSVMALDVEPSQTSKSLPVGPDGKKLKPCCACPETKKLRDVCIVEKGEENCLDLIQAHKDCMRRMGFNV